MKLQPFHRFNTGDIFLHLCLIPSFSILNSHYTSIKTVLWERKMYQTHDYMHVNMRWALSAARHWIDCVHVCKYSGGIMPMPMFAQPEPQPHRKAPCIQAAAAAAKIHWGVNSKESLTARACHAQVEATTQQRCLAKIGARARGGGAGLCGIKKGVLNHLQTYTFANRWAGLYSMRADKGWYGKALPEQ